VQAVRYEVRAPGAFTYHNAILNKTKYDLTMQKPFGHKNTFHEYTSIFALALIAGFIICLFWNLMMPRMDFFNNLWAPANLLLQGKSPYDTASLHPILPPLWYPMAIGFFFPLGWFSEGLALQIWYIFNIIELCIVIFLVQGGNRSLYTTVILALLCFFFPFVLSNYNLGQFSITAMLCMMLSAYFSDSGHDWLAACSLALALSKPQLGILAMFGLGVFYFQRNGLRGDIKFGSQTFLMVLLMSLPLFIFFPTWIPDWLKSIQSIQLWQHPSLISMLRQSIGQWATFTWILIMIPVLWITYLLWKKYHPPEAMMWSLGITTIITPYIWSWDFVLLLPIWMYTFARAEWRIKTFLLILYAISWYGIAHVQLQESSDQHSFWWVPLWFIGVTLIADWRIKLQEHQTAQNI